MDNQYNLYSDEELSRMEGNTLFNQEDRQPVTCLGMTFENDDARRAYFREELRKKLPELKKIEGYPIGEDDDIINLSDPPYYTACPNPWLNDFIAEWEEEKKELVKEGKRKEDFEVKEPYASDVSEGKNNPVYNAHSYYTKCPHPAIMHYILHYTQPGDVVYDGFCGTGMTGVAAALCETPPAELLPSFHNEPVQWGKRHSICSDLSPAASFLASNFTTNRIVNFESVSKKVLFEFKNQLKDLYYVSYKNTKCEVSYILYSDVYVCPNCGKEIYYLGDMFNLKNKDSSKTAKCPFCSSLLTQTIERSFSSFYDNVRGEVRSKKKSLPLVVGIIYNKNIIEVPIEDLDVDYSKKIEDLSVDKWYPIDRFPEGNEGRRNDRTGLLYIDDIYSKENLYATSELYNLVKDTPILKFAFLNTCWHATIMRRYNSGGGHRPKTGTLYVPSISSIGNVYNIYENKLKQLQVFMDYIGNKKELPIIQTSSCTAAGIKDNSVDYIFTDPPFGSNIAYSELNSIWESWLKVKTESSCEAIENVSVNKTLDFYRDLMTSSLMEYFRILKPGKWMTVEFSNTSSAVWNIITTSIQNSGFIIANVSALDKKQGSISAYTTSVAVKQDLVITCYKPSAELSGKMSDHTKSGENVWDFIDEYLAHLPVHIERNSATTTVIERSPKILFDRLISYYVVKGYPVPLDAADFQAGLHERYIERDGMFFTAKQAAEYEEKKKLAPEFVPMGIVVSDEANGVEWLRNRLRDKPQTYQEIQPDWMQAINGVRKHDIIPELMTILEENFIKMDDGKWRLPNVRDDVDVELLQTKALLREFAKYVEIASKPHGKIPDARTLAVRAGFKQCYIDKDFATIVMVGDKMPQNLRDEDEVIYQFYSIALNKI